VSSFLINTLCNTDINLLNMRAVGKIDLLFFLWSAAFVGKKKPNSKFCIESDHTLFFSGKLKSR